MKPTNFLALILVMLAPFMLSNAICQTRDLADERLRDHSKLAEFNPPGSRLSANRGMRTVVSGHESLPTAPLDEALLGHLKRLACRADSIVLGRTGGTAAYHLSDSGTAIYGDHVITVEAVLKDNRAASLGRGRDIVVTRLGGSVRLAGEPVNYETNQYPALRPGVTYLLMLRFLPQSGAYQAYDALSTLVMDQDHWILDRKEFSSIRVAGLSRNAMANTISTWEKTCRQ